MHTIPYLLENYSFTCEYWRWLYEYLNEYNHVIEEDVFVPYSYHMYFKYQRAMNVQIWIRNGQSINIRCQRNLFLVHIKYVCVCVCLTLKSQIFIINPYTTNRDIRTWILEHLALSTYSLNHHAHYEFHREIFYQTVINSQNFALLTIT